MECEASQVRSRYLEDKIRYLDIELAQAEKDIRDLQLETKARDDLIEVSSRSSVRSPVGKG